MLAIDIVFFLLELVTAFLVGSLALMADSFHMVGSAGSREASTSY